MKSKHTLAAVNWGDSAGIEKIAIDEALSAYKPNPRSPAFAVQKIFQIASNDDDEQVFLAREDFLVMFPLFEGADYEGQLSWDANGSCWSLSPGPTVPASRIQQDALRWYLNGWDMSRHTRDLEFAYPEDREFAPSGEGVDRLFNALLPLEDELTRRLFVDHQDGRVGYCDVYKSKKEDLYVAELGFFNDRRTHRLQRITQPFWELEGFTVPSMLKRYQVLSYRIHHIFALRGEME
jgi:hypothetical protein